MTKDGETNFEQCFGHFGSDLTGVGNSSSLRYFSRQMNEESGLSVHQGSTESCKTLEQKYIFQIGTLNPHGIDHPRRPRGS